MTTILLVEDDPDHAALAIRALKKHNLAADIIHLDDGQELIDYLDDPRNPMPRLIMLDLKMPRMDGLEALEKLKSHSQRKVIPVVMMTSSKEEKDISRSYELGVNAYIVKPVDFVQFTEAVSVLGLFWVLLNEPPR